LQIIGELLAAGSHALFVDMSSCHPDTSARLDHLLAPSGCRALDAPVSGGVAKAGKAELMIMAGGSDANFSQAAPYLNLMGTAAHIGPGGAGYAMKALNNYVSAAGLVSSFQALATAQKFGIAPHAFQQIINASTGRNNTTEVKIDKFVIPKTYDSGFALNLMAKDVAIASDIITQNGFTLPLNQPLADYMKQALIQLGGDPDHTEIYRHLEQLAATSPPGAPDKE
jgi:3-hydroxyisobutyrate dehydrogenase